MDVLLPTLVIFGLCFLGISISLLVKGKPIEKKCSSEPDETCRCQDDVCEKDERD